VSSSHCKHSLTVLRQSDKSDLVSDKSDLVPFYFKTFSPIISFAILAYSSLLCIVLQRDYKKIKKDIMVMQCCHKDEQKNLPDNCASGAGQLRHGPSRFMIFTL